MQRRPTGEPQITAAWADLGRPVRSLRCGAPSEGIPQLVVLPGLGALGYLLPLVRACAAWTVVQLLDLPGFGHRATARCPADLEATSQAAAAWLRQVPRGPVLLAGHSTGAQIALHAALAAPQSVTALCLAGPTFPPELRRWGPLARGVVRTVRFEPLTLVPATVPQYLRGRTRVLTLLRSAMADRPEDALARVRCPVHVARGAHDFVCPEPWAQRLAEGAGGPGRARVLPGAHNFPFTGAGAASAWLRAAVG